MSPDPRPADWVSVASARGATLAAMRPLPAETVTLPHALGRVLARSIVSPIDLPRWNNSAMDGFAVRALDVAGAAPGSPIQLRVVGDVPAGAFPERPLRSGEAVRVMTGAPVPEGADGVIRVEHTDGGTRSGGVETVTIRDDQDAGRNIRLAGEDVRAGSEVLEAGRLLRPGELGLAASVGAGLLEVHRRPRVALLATGDELVELSAFDEVRAGRRIVSSNSYTLAAQLNAAGMEVVDLGIAGDTRAGIRERLEGARGCDAVVTSAGVSVGEHDHVRAVLHDLGVRGSFWRVRMRPGSPFAFGTVEGLDGIPWFGLPGNPVSSMVTFEVLVRPALLAMAGHRHLFHPVRRARLDDSFSAAGDLVHFLRVSLHHGPGDALTARLTGPQGSGILSSIAAADALLAVPADGREHRGEILPALLLGGAPLVAEPGY
jgi:molybdopterin molybdotransferase